MPTLDAFNAASPAAAAIMLDGVCEDAPWIAARAIARRPFATIGTLHDTLMATIRDASDTEQLAFLNGHPALAGAAALGGTMGAHSTAEQAAIGLATAPDPALAAMNIAYQDQYGFPFILCVRRHTRTSIMSEFARRLSSTVPAERATALIEIGYIIRLRLVERIDGPGAPPVYGHLSTHILDTAAARPASGIRVELWECGAEPRLLTTATTNADGRTDDALLTGHPLRIGVYELRFHTGPYFGASGLGFLDVIPARFTIREPEGRYHIPLLLSPGAYSVYRGS